MNSSERTGISGRSAAIRWIPSLYFAEGAPAAIVTEVSVLIFMNLHLDASKNMFWSNALGLLPLLFIKLFWAPVIDTVWTKRFWILLTQAVMGVLFLGAAFACGFSGSSAISWLILFFMLAAFFSATHDVAADGFYIIALSEHDQAVYSGLRSVFYRVAMIAANGGLIMLAGYFLNHAGYSPETTWMICLMIPGIFFLLLTLYHFFAIPRNAEEPKHVSREKTGISRTLRDFGQVFLSFIRKKHIGTALAFLLLYRLGEAQLTGVSKIFLISEAGLSQEQYGFLAGTIGVIMMLIGGILAGLLTARYGFGKLLWPMVLLLNVPDLLYVFLSFVPQNSAWFIGTCLAIEQFGYGFGFTGFMLFMVWFAGGSGSCTTSHYALMTIFMILGLRLPGMCSGYLLQHLADWFRWTGGTQYQIFFLWVIVCTIPGYFVTWLIGRIVDPKFGLAADAR